MVISNGAWYPEHLAQVCNLTTLSQDELQAILGATDVSEVWGVWPRIAAQLREGGIKTVLDLARMDTATVIKRWNVTLEPTVREVQWMPCIDMDDVPSPKQQIACTRSFGRPVTDLEPLIEAVSEFASRAAEKLRRKASLAGALQVFIHTSPHRDGPQLSRSVTVPLRRPTADSRVLAKAAADGVLHAELELEPKEGRDRARLMTAMDALNGRFGRGILHVGSTGLQGVKRIWSMRQERLTPQYTTRWADVPVAGA